MGDMTIRRFMIDTPFDDVENEFLLGNLASRNWVRTEAADWDLLWSFEIPSLAKFRSIRPEQRVNHFPGSITLHFKDELHHFLARAADRMAPAAGWYDFFPRTFAMPGDYDRWRAVAAAEPGVIWIRKPKRMMGGIGISLFVDPDVVEPDDGIIIQQYVADPLLLPGPRYKHSLRIYVLVTSLDPLAAFIYPNGPVKFTSRPYGTSPEQLADPVVHLTNPHVQRTNDEVPDPVRAIDLVEYRSRLRQVGHDDDRLWKRIRSVLAQTLVAHREPMLRISRHAGAHLGSCFELFGFDIVIDSGMRPWLIEANVSPGLGARGTPGSAGLAFQRGVKNSMVGDLLELIGAGDAGFSVGSPVPRFQAEHARRQSFEVLYPASDTAGVFSCFEKPGPADEELLDVSRDLRWRRALHHERSA
jgi:hypothetical protein